MKCELCGFDSDGVCEMWPGVMACRGEASCMQRRIERLVERVKKLEELLKSISDRLAWHTDDDADPNNTSPEDATAHVNGLVRQEIAAALAPGDAT